jgi:amphi-Trp domain-containing protein
MSEETIFETENRATNAEIAEYLRKVADSIESHEKLRLESGDQSLEIETNSRDATFEVKVEQDTEKQEQSLELEIEWAGDSATLEIN